MARSGPKLFIGGVLVVAPATAGSFGLFEIGVMLVGGLLVLWGLASAYMAMSERASDIVLGPSGLRLEGGRRAGLEIPWADLSTPYAKVEGAGFASLFLFRHGEPIEVASTGNRGEKQSLDAVASTIEAIQLGRRHVEQSPTIGVQVLRCSACGGVATPDDAPEVPCAYCGASVPVPAPMREQAASVQTMQSARSRTQHAAALLLRQPRATPTNRFLVPIWLLMLATWPVAFVLAYRGVLLWDLDVDLGLASSPLLLLLVPVAAVLSAYFLGHTQVVHRRAMRLLTLGFGALAPAREGDPSSCRACLAPLPQAALEGVTQCRYCGADNILGIDLRPVVDKARAQQQSFDGVIRQQRRSTWTWRGAAAVALIALVATIAVGYRAIRTQRAFWSDKEVACLAGAPEACMLLFERHYLQWVNDIRGLRGSREAMEREAAAGLAQSCQQGHAKVCLALGQLYRDGDRITQDLDAAAQYFEHACSQGDEDGCRQLEVPP